MSSFTSIQKALAWSVHVFTASGLLAGFMAILAIEQRDWKMAMVWLVVCLVIDGIDGTFARLFNVKEVLPNVDGKTIDYVIDFATYAIIPAYFFYHAELVEEIWRFPCTAIILLVSAIYYGREGMVTDDYYFVGFPVLWNLVVFYLFFVTQFSPTINTILILIFAIMHFIPIKFAYPSQASKLKTLTLVVTVIFFSTLVGILHYYPIRNVWLTGSALAVVGYFAILAIYNTWIEK